MLYNAQVRIRTKNANYLIFKLEADKNNHCYFYCNSSHNNSYLYLKTHELTLGVSYRRLLDNKLYSLKYLNYKPTTQDPE